MKSLLTRSLCLCLICALLLPSLIFPANATGGMIYVGHPGYIFGEPDDITYNKKNHTLDFHYDISKDPQSQLKELSELQAQYGMALEKDTKGIFGSSRTMVLSFGEDLVTCFWEKSEKELTVSVDTDLRLEWIQDEAEVSCWYEDEYPADYLKEQITLMQELYNLPYDGSVDLPGGGISLWLGSNGEVRYDWYEQEHLVVATYQNGWMYAGIDTSSTTEAADKEASDPNALPSFLDFDTADLFTISEAKEHNSYYNITYTAYGSDALNVANNYIQQLRSNYQVINGKYKDFSDWYLDTVLLDHPADVTPQRLEVVDFYDYPCDVYLTLNYFASNTKVTLGILYVKELSMKDFQPTGGGGSNDPSKKDCTWCGGDGRCNECGGDGRVRTSLAGTGKYVDQNCTYCNGGKCRVCGGDGKN